MSLFLLTGKHNSCNFMSDHDSKCLLVQKSRTRTGTSNCLIKGSKCLYSFVKTASIFHLQAFKETAEQAENWLSTKEAFLANEDLGVSIV